jgi:signal transduction histidine kinase/CheY-like chemotaxis protein
MNLFRLSSKEEYREKFPALSPLTQPDGRLSGEAAQEHLRRALEQGRDQFEWLHQTLDGTPSPAEVTLVRFENNNERSLLGYTRDLTELKRKEDELDKERRLLRKIMDTSPVCFVILVDEVVRSATPFAQDFFGISVGAKAVDLCANEQECSDFLRDVRQFGSINWRVVSMRAADGSTREMLANAFLAEYDEEPCVMSWFLDITEMRESERQLRLARDAAEESARAKGEFLANMSHEIRTPMNAILGMARLVLDTELTAKQRNYLEKAEHSARALLRILNDILDFSKIEAGKLEMESTEFRMAEVLRDVTDMLREGAKAKGLALALSLDLPASLSVQGDPLRLHQILTNLIGNAIKFTRQGGVYVHAALKERARDSATFSFHVRDTGIGLGPAQLERLFSAFSQADASTTRRYGGTGLGLAISKRLVEMMQGEILCASEQGQGAEFSFSAVFALPPAAHDAVREDESKEPLPAASRDPRGLVAHLKGKRLLLAEDNDINQIVARETLEQAGFTVEIAENGREAIEMALAKRYDLILMDIQMPEMDGLAAAAELRRHPHLRDIPIVAMTAHAMSGDKEKSLAVGMNDHITKPIDPEKVFSVIARWLLPEVPELP